MSNLAYQDRDAPGIGHNASPVTDPFPALKSRADQLAAAANEWLANVKAITDLETAEACDSFLAQIAAELTASDKDRKAINAPHDTAIKANNERFRPVTTLLETCQRLLKPLKAGWLQRDRERQTAEKRAAEEAALKAMQEAEDARKAAEAAAAPTVQAAIVVEETAAKADAAIAALAEAERARPVVKGGLAARASGLRTYWFAEITDWSKAVAHYDEDPRVREVVQALANAEARTSHEKMMVAGAVAKSEERV